MNTELIFSDIPDSPGMENALRRARQLAELKWTPVQPFPAIVKTGAKEGPAFTPVFLPAWRPQTGMNYSGARFDEKYLGLNVSIETFMTALSNPESVLYTHSLHGRTPLAAAFYGTVCSEFASYVMDIPLHIDCQQWPFLDGIEQIDPEPLENLKLCDILNERTRHTAVITGIRRDVEGKIVDITVTESTPPNIQSKVFTPKEFTEYWLKNNYEILRYKKIDGVTYQANPWVRLEGDPELPKPQPNPTLMPDYGDKANYILGEKIYISVHEPRYDAVEVYVDDAVAERLPVSDGKVTFSPAFPGFFRITAVTGEERSNPVYCCVVDASAKTNKTHYAEGVPVKVSFVNQSTDSLLGWVVKTSDYAKYWAYLPDGDGGISDSAILPPGSYLIIALYRNEYGIYSSRSSEVFEVKERTE